jgi:hypothetical protein
VRSFAQAAKFRCESGCSANRYEVVIATCPGADDKDRAGVNANAVRDAEVVALYRVVARFELLAYYVLNSPLNLQRTFGRAGVFCVTDNFTTTSLSSAPRFLFSWLGADLTIPQRGTSDKQDGQRNRRCLRLPVCTEIQLPE